MKRRTWKSALVLAIPMVLVAGLGAVPAVAAGPAPDIEPLAATPVYELNGRWSEAAPAELRTGELVISEWRLNVNDDADAPSNEPVDDVTFTVTATNGVFDAIPNGCLTDGVTPPSSISADGTVLTCNVGTQAMGSAVFIQAPVIVDGEVGDELALVGNINGQPDAPGVPPLPIIGTFGMDITWESPTSFTRWLNSETAIRVDYQWTLNLMKGSEAGPNSVSYTITLNPQPGGVTSTIGCSSFESDMGSGHPRSGPGAPAEQTAPFVGSCTLTPTGTANTYTMTLTGIDYSQAQVPTQDSGGNPLPVDRVAVASGRVVFDLPTTAGAGSLSLTSSAPTYTSASAAATSIDDASNNTVSKTFAEAGNWASTWNRGATGGGGTNWDYTYRAAPGATLVAHNHSKHHITSANFGQTVQQCTVLETAWVTFATSSPTWPALQDITGTGNFIRPAAAGTPGMFVDDEFDHTMWYYVGNNAAVTPGSGSYNPEAFAANCDVDPGGWTTTKPADVSTIKAVRTSYQVTTDLLEFPSIVMLTYATIKPTAPVGQDIWQFSSYKIGASWWYIYANPITSTPGVRYPYTTGFRDVVRVAGVAPYVEKSVDRAAVQVGEAAVYTIGYAANGGSAAPATVDNFGITDTLPIGMEYVPATATVGEPVVTVDGTGKQVLTWTLNGVPTNQLLALTYQARANSDAIAGKALTNTASASVSGMNSAPAQAQVVVSASGVTKLGKTADQAYIPNLAGDGVGEGSWTVTLRSYDPAVQEFTDTIDVLPYAGDGRGTLFPGTYAVTGVTAVAGATVYYTDAAPTTLSDDPAHPSNGSAGDVTGNTAGWSETKPANVTAVRVIGPALEPAKTQAFTVAIQTDGARGGDRLVNRAHARTEHTELSMLTSAATSVANYYSASLKKYVQDSDGEWHDANTVEDYPTFFGGDSVPYRIVITNTGQGVLTNLVIADDRYPAEGGFTVPTLAPGDSSTHEFTIALAADAATGTLVNTATASADIPAETGVAPTINIDPAGVVIDEVTFDFGDAPAEYATALAGDGPRHRIVDGLQLGADVDSEPDGQPNAAADGDGADEDGVEINPLLGYANATIRTGLDPNSQQPMQNTLEVEASDDGFVSVWVDWNEDGDFLDGGEQVANAQAVTAGTNNVTFAQTTNPPGIETYMRVRYSTDAASIASPTGAAPDGEVEDYRVLVERLIQPDSCVAIGSEYYSFTFNQPAAVDLTGAGGPGTTATYRNVTVVGGVLVDMKITLLAGDLQESSPGGLPPNGLGVGDGAGIIDEDDARWQINRDATLRYEFFEAGTSAPIEVSAVFTANDMDGPNTESATFTAADLVGYAVTQGSAVTIEESGGNVVFHGGALSNGDPGSRFQVAFKDKSAFEVRWRGGVGSGFGFDGDGDLSIQTPACSVPHPLQVEKLGEALDGTWVRMAGSEFAIHVDNAGVMGDELAAPVLDEIETGLFEADDLPSGTYWLVETKAPDGFNLLAEAVQFTLLLDGTVTITNGGDTVTADGGMLITVRDVPALVMPETGGTGSLPYQAAGVLMLLIAAGVWRQVRRRESAWSRA